MCNALEVDEAVKDTNLKANHNLLHTRIQLQRAVKDTNLKANHNALG